MVNSGKVSDGGSLPHSGRRGRPREFDRARAVHVAMEVFWRNGYMLTTLGDLCKAMAITAPSFYCAFRTKEDLFLETVDHYFEIYWKGVLERLMAETDIHLALQDFLKAVVGIYLRPGLPKGCFFDISTVGLSPRETRIIAALAAIEKRTMELVRKRLIAAVEAGQLSPASNIPAITGSLLAFLKGIAAIARKDMCQAELQAISFQGLLLLPPHNADC